ncbi:MAG: SIR2 family protein [Sedimentisphaerales bacterium]|jgi:hypothetical protein
MMDDQSRRHLEEMIDILNEGKLLLLAGAGLSLQVGIPGWHELLNEFSREYKARPGHSEKRAEEIDKFAENNNLDLFEVMKGDTQGNFALIDVLKRHFDNKKCGDIHRRILALPFKGYATTNYDTCFENACIKYGVCSDMLDSRWFCFPKYRDQNIDTEKLFNGERFLLHMHGCFCYKEGYEVENIILTQNQYRKFYSAKEMGTILGKFGKNHLLILGSSLTDPHFVGAMSDLRISTDKTQLANRLKWYKLCDGIKDCYPMRDEENLGIHHIHYESGRDGILDTIMKMEEAVDVRKRPVSVFADPSKIGVREDIR